jgi:hypothetical protein
VIRQQALGPQPRGHDHQPHLTPSEDAIRLGAILLVIWLVIGVVAAGQRHYFGSSGPSCARASTIAATIAAGPLNFAGVDPKVSCKASA